MSRELLVILGAGGHGRVAADIGRLCGYGRILFLDDAKVPAACGKVAEYVRYKQEADFFVAIGSGAVREKLQNMLLSDGCTVVSLIHPRAVIGSCVRIGVGCAVMAGAVIQTGASVGEGSIINTCSSVDHDCTLEPFCHVSVGAHLAGTVYIGKQTVIGAGAAVINNIRICGDCVIGAGAVVVKNIQESGTYVGVPARKIR